MKQSWFVKEKSFYKTLLALALPIALQNLITFAVNFADNVMVGTLGEIDISAVYMGRQIATVLQCLTNGIGMTMLVLIAQYWGKKEMDPIKHIAVMGLRIAFCFGIVYSAVSFIFAPQILSILTSDMEVVQAGIPYLRITALSFLFFSVTQALLYALRGVENAKFGMRLSFLTLAVNVTFNYILIFGKLGAPALGIKGAAIATLAARIAECITVLLYVFLKEKNLSLKLSSLTLRSKPLLKDMVRYGIPLLGGEVVWAINTFFQSAAIGRFDEEVMAAFSITIMLSNLIYVWASGLASAVGVITGKTVGRGEFEKMKQYAKTVQVLFVLVGLFSAALILGIRGPFISLYNVTAATVAQAKELMIVLAVVMAGTCYQMVGLAGLVKSGGDTKFVMINDSIHVFLVIIPATVVVISLGAPAWVVFACLKCDQVLKCFVAVIKI
ncbi:MAG: MATE family efflux transporter, partial [Clostridia bacterium]|nr:MATE family efflux transporter [Clostridia bacterium]